MIWLKLLLDVNIGTSRAVPSLALWIAKPRATIGAPPVLIMLADTDTVVAVVALLLIVTVGGRTDGGGVGGGGVGWAIAWVVNVI